VSCCARGERPAGLARHLKRVMNSRRSSACLGPRTTFCAIKFIAYCNPTVCDLDHIRQGGETIGSPTLKSASGQNAKSSH
jgi:hypothetical protein